MYFGMAAKLAKEPSAGVDAWIDPAGYQAAVAERHAAFLTELHRQQAAAARARPMR